MTTCMHSEGVSIDEDRRIVLEDRDCGYGSEDLFRTCKALGSNSSPSNNNQQQQQ